MLRFKALTSIFQSKDEHETGFPFDRRESDGKNEEAA